VLAFSIHCEGHYTSARDVEVITISSIQRHRLHLHISTKALMISFFPGATAPVLSFAFFKADAPFVRFLFAMTEDLLSIQSLITNSAKASAVEVL
jgi:hypothetical protein